MASNRSSWYTMHTDQHICSSAYNEVYGDASRQFRLQLKQNERATAKTVAVERLERVSDWRHRIECVSSIGANTKILETIQTNKLIIPATKPNKHRGKKTFSIPIFGWAVRQISYFCCGTLGKCWCIDRMINDNYHWPERVACVLWLFRLLWCAQR